MYLLVSVSIFLVFSERSFADRIASSKVNPNDAIPFSLSISGGVSLGSYEAGINWALLYYLKLQRKKYEDDKKGRYFLFPEVSSVSGASAGSINALFSAISWCVDDHIAADYSKENKVVYKFQDSLENNLFRDIWVNVGIEKLLPDSKIEGNYSDDDGLFTRQAFDEAINNVKSALKQAIFRENCVVPFGITVTRVKPGVISVAGVKVNNQRFMIPFRIEANQKKKNTAVIVSHIVNKNDEDMGNVMYLQGQKDSASSDKFIIDVDDLVDSILTSSAFPIAFGRKKLKYCSRIQDKKVVSNSNLCPDGYQEDTDEFLDGGVFDNVPLGIAKALAEPKPTDYDLKKKWKKSARRYNYVYIDPDNLRSTSNEKKLQSKADVPTAPKQMTFGLSTQLKFLEGAINTGRNYELYNLLRGGDWTRQTFSFACNIYSIVHNTNEDSCVSSNTPVKRCIGLYNKIDSKKNISRMDISIKDLSSCLLSSAFNLEREYTLKVNKRKHREFNCKNNTNNKYTGERILAARSCLLNRLRKLASNLNRPELVYAIGEALKDELGDRRILITSRFGPITGNLLSYFGAFLDRAFREYDYYAGVYDALNVIAVYHCKRIKSQRCLANRIKFLYNGLGIERSAAANTVFMLLVKQEHDTSTQAWRWIDNKQAIKPKNENEKILVSNLKVIYESLKSTVEKNKIKELTLFEEFLFFSKTLFSNNYNTSQSSNFLKRVERLKDEDSLSWFFPITTNIANRLIQLESLEVEKTNKPSNMRQLLGIGSLAVHSYIKNGDESFFRQSSAPDNSWQKYLPYEFGVDARNGGLLIAWEPSLALSKSVGLNLNVAPILIDRFADSEILFSQASLYLSYYRSSIISSVGFGPTLTSTWKQWPNSNQTNIGASAYAGLLKDKLRLTVGVRSFRKDNFYGDTFFIDFSVTDIPGFIYWLVY